MNAAQLIEEASKFGTRPGETKVYPNTDALVKAAGQYWAIENLGMDPERDGPNSFENDEQYEMYLDELKSWLKDAKKALPKLIKSGKPLTVGNLWDASL